MTALPTEFLLALAKAYASLSEPLPLDFAAELMDRGYMLDDLESKWSAETYIS